MSGNQTQVGTDFSHKKLTYSAANKNKKYAVHTAIKVNAGAWLLILPSLLLFTVFVWQPLISGVILSLFETKGYEIVKFTGLQNYIDVISDSAFKGALVNSFTYTVWSLVIGFVIPIVIAIVINEIIHFSAFFRFSIYFPTMVPGVAASLLWYFMFEPGEQGMVNSILIDLGLPASQWLQDPKLSIPLIVLTMTWRGFGSAAIIYLASLQGINNELYEASTLDGAGVLNRVRYITLPQISNIIGLMLIMQIIGVFQVMYEPLTMTDGGPNNASISLMLQAYFYGFRYFEAGRSMAVSAITFFILVMLTAVYFKVNKDREAE